MIVAVTVSFSALTFLQQGRVQLGLVAKFQNSGIELDVVTIVNWEAESSTRVALLGFATPLHILLLQSSGMVVVNRPMVEGGVGALLFLENYRLDEGDRNIGTFSPHHKRPGAHQRAAAIASEARRGAFCG